MPTPAGYTNAVMEPPRAAASTVITTPRRVARLSYPAAHFSALSICCAPHPSEPLLLCCAQLGHRPVGKSAGHNWAEVKGE